MPTPNAKDAKKWDSQYKNDFRPRKYPRQVAARPTSGTRRNNPHPVQDFLLSNRHPRGKVDGVVGILRTAVAQSAPMGIDGQRDLNSIPVGPVPRLEPELNAVGPHWSQWPQQPKTDRPQYNVRIDLSPRVPNSAREPRLSQREPVLQYEAAMNMGDRNVIMHRGLSPRRQAPRVPGRSLTHYGSFGNREDPNPYIGGLDLHASPYNANRGYDQGITSYSSRDRQSRPMHRHMRTANKGEEYVHNHSNFYSTAPMVTGYFIIHPDWVSERLSLRRSQSLLSF